MQMTENASVLALNGNPLLYTLSFTVPFGATIAKT